MRGWLVKVYLTKILSNKLGCIVSLRTRKNQNPISNILLYLIRFLSQKIMTKTLPIKKVHFGFLSFLLLILHFPVLFSSSLSRPEVVRNFPAIDSATTETNSTMALYQSLNLSAKGLSQEAYELAVQGYEKLVSLGKVPDKGIITIADFSRSSAKERLYVIDVNNAKVLFQTYVAHGRNSGEEFANKFSNVPESFTSSLGFYSTAGTYIGENGYSLKLNGLEAGINDRAYERAIVMHGAEYANDNFRRQKGYLGRSYGCPAVPEKMNKPIIDKIKNGTVLFIYSNKSNYLKQSKIV